MEIGFYADALNDLNVYLTAVDDAKSFYLRGLAKIHGKIELIEACDDFIKARSLGSYEAGTSFEKILQVRPCLPFWPFVMERRTKQTEGLAKGQSSRR